MKFLFTLLSFIALSTGVINAQSITETEPNDSYAQANVLPANTTLSGQTCNSSDPDFFRIILPQDSKLVFYTSASIPDATVPPNGGLTFDLISKNHTDVYSISPRVGVNGAALLDTLQWCCLAADTFYIEGSRGWAFPLCFSYTLNWVIVPASYTNDAEPDYHPAPAKALPLTYNTPADGHLGFQWLWNTQVDGDDYYTIVPPTDGTLRVHISAEAQMSADHALNVTVYNASNADLYSQYFAPGNFKSPHDTILYWGCIGGDTMHIGLSISHFLDRGYSYRLSYDMIAPVFNNDIESNNDYAHAQVFNPNTPVEGHEYFYGDGSPDYFKFFKPDSGDLKVYVQAETSGGTAQGGCYVEAYNSQKNYLGVVFAGIGTNSQPVYDTLTTHGLKSDSIYLHVYNSSGFASCMSYRLDVHSPGIDGIREVSGVKYLNVYPNPSSNQFTIDMGGLKNAELKIYNTLGQLIETIRQPNNQKVVLGGELPAGVYLVKVKDALNMLSICKLIKTK